VPPDFLFSEQPSGGWALVSLTQLDIAQDHDQDWAAQGHADPYVWVTIANGPTYKSAYFVNDNSVNDIKMHLYAPASGTASITVWDDDTLTPDDEIGTADVDLSASGTFTISIKKNVCKMGMCESNRWWLPDYPCWKCAITTVGTLSATILHDGLAMDARVSQLSEQGVELTRAWYEVIDPDTLSQLWTQWRYFGTNLGYLFNGNLMDEAGKPGSGIWNYVSASAGAFGDSRLASGPGPGTTSIISHDLAVKAMTALPSALANHDRFRGNELGVQIFNGEVWPEKPSHSIGLGDSFIDHARARPLLDAMVGPAAAKDPANRAAIKEAAAAFWEGHEVTTDATSAWASKLLHKFHLGLDISDNEADEFVSRQLQYLAMASAPSRTLACIAIDCADLLAYKAAQIEKYKLALSAKFPSEWSSFSELARTKVASQVMDSLLFAGGISIPTVIKFSFAVLYGEYGKSQLGDDWKLTDAKLMQFVLEVVRRFPPVAGFPSWDRTTNHHTIVDLFMSNLDPTSSTGWGATARDFKLRSIAEYHTKHIGWADKAIYNGDNAHPNSRVCPAKDLSITIIVEFLRAFLTRGGQSCWTTTQRPSDITMTGYSATVVALTEEAKCRAVHDNAILTVKDLLGFSSSSRPFMGQLFDALTIDDRFDLYTRAIALVVRSTYDTPPQTAAAVTKPVAMQDVPAVPCGLVGTLVPKEDEHQDDVKGIVAVGDLANRHLGFPETADDCGVWRDGEDPEAIIRSQIGVWPTTRILNPLSDNRYSDQQLEDTVFRGVGQHRLSAVRDNDAAAPANAKYAVYLGFASSLEMRPGFARFGADAYFDADGSILAIVRLGKTYLPVSRGGALGTSVQCTEEFRLGFWYPVCDSQYEDGWLHAKMAFRGTLIFIITAIDHLHGVHLTAGNALVTANVEELPPAHVIRRLLTPFGFRTEAINYKAAIILTPEDSLVHRGSGLTEAGMTAAFSYANSTSESLKFRTIPELKALKGLEISLPIDEDGLEYYAILKRFVHGYLSSYFNYGSNACGADVSLGNWYQRVSSIAPHMDLPKPLTCETLEDVLATLMYHVSASHRHTGTIAAETEDPCWAPTAWREGYLCGLPRTAFVASTIMASTGLEQPKIVEDYTHMFDDEAGKQAWRMLTSNLTVFEEEIVQRNKARRVPYNVFLPSKIETGVGI